MGRRVFGGERGDGTVHGTVGGKGHVYERIWIFDGCVPGPIRYRRFIINFLV